MDKKNIRIIDDPVYGFKRLDPIPRDSEISDFYQSKYYELIRKGGRAPELRRLMGSGEETEREKRWLREGLYTDISFCLGQYAPGKKILDVGCGVGDFISYLKENGFAAEGIELSNDAAGLAKSRGLTVYNCRLEELTRYYNSDSSCRFDAITLVNVLEHVPHPSELIDTIKLHLVPDGILCIRVPNDFSKIQIETQKNLGVEPWWIAYPDHINYFSCNSLKRFLEKKRFEIVYMQTDFPMELFLLMGENYVGNSEVGRICHRKRIRFDTSISAELRRKIYQSLATIGVGRDSLCFGRIVKK